MTKRSTNTLYIARDKLTWNKNKPGTGIFKFNKNLVLTKKGFSRAKWKLPKFFKDVEISYHSDKSWKDGYFQSALIGQEFVIKDNKKVENWAKSIINN
jgi:hypothetical protein